MTINSSVIEPFLTWSPEAIDVPLTNGLRIQILPSLDDLYRARRHQYAAFIASEALLIVWDDDPTKLFDRAKRIEDELLQFVWQDAGDHSHSEKVPDSFDADLELGLPAQVPERPIVYYDAFLVGCAACLLIFLVGLGYGEIVQEVVVLKSYISLGLLLMTPIDIFLSLVSDPVAFHDRPQANHRLVFRPRCHQVNCSVDRSRPANVKEFKILFSRGAATSPYLRPAARDHSNARLQGRPWYRYRSHYTVTQEGYLNL